jgi:hypothetical protein
MFIGDCDLILFLAGAEPGFYGFTLFLRITYPLNPLF